MVVEFVGFCCFIFEVEAPNDPICKMRPNLYGMPLLTCEPALSGHSGGQRCAAFQIPPWIRAHIAIPPMPSAVCAISCPQAQITLPRIENHPKLQGTELSERC